MDRALGPDSLDIEAAQRLTRSAGIDSAATALAPLGVGVKGRAWRVDFAEHDSLVLKLYSRSGAVVREHAGYGVRAELDLAMPEMLGGTHDAHDAPGGWTLMTLAPGEPMNESLAVLPRSRMLAIYEQIGDQLRTMHDRPCPSFSLVVDADNGAPDNVTWFNERVAAGIDGFLAQGGNAYLAAQVKAYLSQYDDALACCEVPSFCHADMHPENIRIEPAGSEAEFVGSIDLEESIAADPAQDLARTLHTCPSPGPDIRAALFSGYGEPPAWFDRVLPAYHLYYELELWNYFASGGSRRPLASIARRMAAQSGASRWRIARSRVRRVISPTS